MKNCVKLNWPSLTEIEHKKIIECFDSNIENVYRPSTQNKVINDQSVAAIYHPKIDVDNQPPGFYHLYNWENYVDFFKDIFKNHDVNHDVLNLFSIQRSLVNVPAHSDVGRNFIIYYLVKGSGDSVFYHCDKFVRGVAYHNRMKELTEIERVTMEEGSWYLFNNYEIHAVENMSQKRYSLAFDISKIIDSYEDAYNNIENSKILFL